MRSAMLLLLIPIFAQCQCEVDALRSGVFVPFVGVPATRLRLSIRHLSHGLPTTAWVPLLNTKPPGFHPGTNTAPWK